ncbi:MAG: hypothetical protein ACSHXA_12915 [Polaribacter sp.]|uniref:hypothetical protein n=1 Tax=Polaribacter sp. TaxID=1920175 RepID=UPI003EF3860B
MIKKIAFSFLFLIAISAFSQERDINNYKYVIVPDRFDFLKSSDQYQTSSLTKFLLEKKGFEVFLSNEKLPEDLMLNRCKALTAIVVDDSSMFTIKSVIKLQDCNNNVLYTSEVGKSKLKEYKKGYQEAIRKAYETMEDLEYNYNTSIAAKEKIKPEIVKEKESVVTVKTSVKEINTNSNVTNVLYAQKKNNGFQLVNLTPEVVFIILNTNKKNVYVIKGKDGTLYKNGEIWIAEYYKNDQLVKEEYQIKF